MAKERRILDCLVPNTFTSRTDDDCLLDCCTFVDRSMEYRFNHPLQQRNILNVEDRSFDEDTPIEMVDFGFV